MHSEVGSNQIEERERERERERETSTLEYQEERSQRTNAIVGVEAIVGGLSNFGQLQLGVDQN